MVKAAVKIVKIVIRDVWAKCLYKRIYMCSRGLNIVHFGVHCGKYIIYTIYENPLVFLILILKWILVRSKSGANYLCLAAAGFKNTTIHEQ